jgi:hypothetical protein
MNAALAEAQQPTSIINAPLAEAQQTTRGEHVRKPAAHSYKNESTQEKNS